MALISVITACTRPKLLPQLAATVLQQEVDLEWLVQLDGTARAEERAVRSVIDDDRLRLQANPRDAGSAVSRNLALIRASGEFVLCVDDDDLLCPGGLRKLEAALLGHEDCFAAWGEARTFTDDPKESVDFKRWFQAGRIGPDEICELFRQTGQFAVHVGACLWRKRSLETVGGYAALLRSIDTNPFLACERVWPFVYVDTPVYLYRIHGGQMTQTQYYRELQARTHDFNLARADGMASVATSN